MSLTLISRAALPVSRRGATGTLSVRVSNNGQIGFSTSAGKFFDNHTSTLINWDGDARKMIFTPVNTNQLPKGVKEEATFKVGQSKDGKNRYISAAELFKLPAVAYDYTVGTYSFEAEIDGKNLSFALPAKMATKEVKPRKPRAAKAAAGTSGNGGATAISEPEAELQEA